ncbi:MAG: CHAT domain-containing protein [Phormidesmis sp.]
MGTLHPLRIKDSSAGNCHLKVVRPQSDRPQVKIASLTAQKREIQFGKRVVLSLGTAVAQGIPVTLQIGNENKIPDIAITGWLPPATRLMAAYDAWQQAYQCVSACDARVVNRLRAPAAQPTNMSLQEIVKSCCDAEEMLTRCINQWLNSALFRPVRETLLAYCHPSERIRLILQTDDLHIQKLPLHRWDWFERYSQAELVLGSATYTHASRIEKDATSQLNVLAVLGESHDLDVECDLALLQNLPNASVTCLKEPTRSQLNEALWDQPWDIILFAGHSECQGQFEDQSQGKFRLNAQESFSLDELENGLKRAIAQNLKLLILNTCDSLTLLKSLKQNLCLPATIAMRQPVPDIVAQTFLRYFLTAFSKGQLLPHAVREAREKLQGIDHQFPCASSIPVLYQTL